MKFTSFAVAAPIAFALHAFALPAPAQTAMVATYDTVYDDPSGLVSSTACDSVLVPKGYTTFNSFPNFPYIGGMKIVTSGSELCGSCWNITHDDVSINFLAIDNLEDPDVNLSYQAMLKLDDGGAPGRLDVTVEKLPPSECGMH